LFVRSSLFRQPARRVVDSWLATQFTFSDSRLYSGLGSHDSWFYSGLTLWLRWVMVESLPKSSTHLHQSAFAMENVWFETYTTDFNFKVFCYLLGKLLSWSKCNQMCSSTTENSTTQGFELMKLTRPLSAISHYL